MSTCNWLDSESLVSPPVMPKISTDTVVAIILEVGMLELGTLTKRFGVTYYLESHILIPFYYQCNYLPCQVVIVLYCPKTYLTFLIKYEIYNY